MPDDQQKSNPLIPDLTPLTWQERMTKLMPEIALFRFLQHPEDPAVRHELYKSALGTNENEALLAPPKFSDPDNKWPDSKWVDKTQETEKPKGFFSWLGF